MMKFIILVFGGLCFMALVLVLGTCYTDHCREKFRQAERESAERLKEGKLEYQREREKLRSEIEQQNVQVKEE